MPSFPVFSEPRHRGEHLVSEAPGHLSREAIVIAAGADLFPGTVLGKVTLGAATAAAKSGGNTGNGTCSAVTVLANAKTGAYAVRFTAATAFTVEDPDGFVIGSGVTGAAFGDDIQFTISAGGTPFIAGDGFDIAVAPGTGKYKALTLAAADGSQIATGVLFSGALAASADKSGVAHVRACEIHGNEIIWPAGITTPQKTAAIAQLAAAGIIVR